MLRDCGDIGNDCGRDIGRGIDGFKRNLLGGLGAKERMLRSLTRTGLGGVLENVIDEFTTINKERLGVTTRPKIFVWRPFCIESRRQGPGCHGQRSPCFGLPPKERPGRPGLDYSAIRRGPNESELIVWRGGNGLYNKRYVPLLRMSEGIDEVFAGFIAVGSRCRNMMYMMRKCGRNMTTVRRAREEHD